MIQWKDILKTAHANLLEGKLTSKPLQDFGGYMTFGDQRFSIKDFEGGSEAAFYRVSGKLKAGK